MEVLKYKIRGIECLWILCILNFREQFAKILLRSLHCAQGSLQKNSFLKFKSQHIDLPQITFEVSVAYPVELLPYMRKAAYSILIVINFFYILIMDEKVLVLCEKWLSKFSSNLYVLRPPESEKMVFTKVSVCLSVCSRSCAA